ncbi:MAG: peptide deformylase [Paludibacteraceae bacterium]|nr:peptide deformylase [Paludibacteraceae bacterium]
MVREIMHDPLFLAQKSEPATEEDRQVVKDLLDTLRAHLDGCVGMAGNMIGVLKNIIVVCIGNKQVAFINPIITKKSKPYPTEEGCLSLPGIKKTIRYDEIEVEFLDANFKPQRKRYTGWTAQIIQHEVDHCNGILI